MNRLNDNAQNTVISQIGFFLICIFALSKIHAPDAIPNLVSGLAALLGLYSIYKYGNNISVKMPFLLLAGSLFIPLMSWFFAHLSYPEWVDSSPKLDKLSRIFLFIPIAWWLKDSSKRIFWFWSLAALSVLASPWIGGGGWEEIQQGLNGVRIDYNLRNAGHTSLFFGFVAIGVICFLPRMYRWKRKTLLIALPVILFCLFTLAAAQTRAAWLALIITCILITALFCLKKENRKHLSKKTIVICLIITTCFGMLVSNSFEKLLHRQSKESSIIENIISGQIDKIPYSSTGTRIHLWSAGIMRIEQRPILGWANNGQEIAIDKNDWIPEKIKKRFGHLHNVYLSMLTNYGFLGLGLYLVLFSWLFIKTINTTSERKENNDIRYFSIAILTFWSTVNLFESYLFFWTGVFCIQILFGGLLAFIWKSEIENKKLKSNPETTKNTIQKVKKHQPI